MNSYSLISKNGANAFKSSFYEDLGSLRYSQLGVCHHSAQPMSELDLDFLFFW